MNSLKSDELRVTLSRIWMINHNAKESFELCKYLYHPETREELNYINNDIGIQYLRHLSWRNTVVELCKLFSNRNTDKYNLSHFLNQLNLNQYFGDLGIDENQLILWKARIKSLSNPISKILNLRDKVYSHTDNINPSSLETPSLKDVESLIVFVEDILQKLYSLTQNTYLDTETLIVNSKGFSMVKNLVELQNRQSSEIIDMINNYKKK
ncbi:hypothetical protein [Jiulongibacter sediminis]|jgi:hypothetical protein|uniref:AbiU2 domain-containing protein n=1 Tax=Jiulongibacter sediminis TaxID=1605367 RepID=UPI0026E94603|nr:hypothetical protein [Jiulongibacter sediminis]